MKKKFNFKAAVFGAAALVAGACVSIPAFLPSNVMAATEAVEATSSTEASDRVVVSRTIRFYYKNDDGTTRPVKNTEGGDFKIVRSAIFQAGDTSSTAELSGYQVPSIPGYTPDKSYIDGITVTSKSKPEDVIVYYTEDASHKKTYETETKEMSRRITFYRVGDDGKASQTYQKTQKATVSRNIITYGDGKKEYGAWQSYTFPGESVPAMSGYTASLSEVPSVAATPDNPPADVVVYYRKSGEKVLDAVDITSFTVIFTDGFGKTLKKQTVNAGTKATAPANPTKEGYTFARWDADFSNVRSDLTVNAKWTPNKTEVVEESKTVTRTISYYHADGSIVKSKKTGGHAKESDSVTFKRIGIKDTVTGKTKWSDWSKATSIPEREVMYYAGYTPDKAVIPAQSVDYNSKSWEVKVYYTKNGASFVKTKTGWEYHNNGKIDTSYTGMAKNKYGWWYVKNGKLDTTYTGMAKNQYGWFYMKNGKLDTSYTGMAKNQYGWFYIKNGKLDLSYNGVAKNQYGFWYIQKGKLNTRFNGTVNYNGKKYSVINGKVRI